MYQSIPSGVIANIMTAIYHVDPDIKYRLLNKQIYRETAQAFYDNYNNQFISKLEYLNYIHTQPLKFGYFIFNHSTINVDSETQMMMYYYDLSLFNRNQYNIMLNTLIIENKNGVTFSKNKMDNKSLTDPLISPYVEQLVIENFDLFTKYNIYKSRTNCTIINKNYPKQKILYHISTYKDISTKSFLRIYCYYQYLILNCFVVNILDRVYDLIPKIEFKYAPLPKEVGRKDIESVLENPIDVDIYNQQKIIMLNEIDRLEIKLMDYINTNL